MEQLLQAQAFGGLGVQEHGQIVTLVAVTFGMLHLNPSNEAPPHATRIVE